MKFLLLWSGDKIGMRKGTVQGVESKGIVGHYREGKVYVPNGQQIRELLPLRYRKAWDRQKTHWNELPQLWQDARNNLSPLTIRLLYSNNNKPMLTLYLHPLDKES